MKIKHCWIFLLPVLLSACSSGKFYFNKRIDHSHQEAEEQTFEEKTVEEKTVQPVLAPSVMEEETVARTDERTVFIPAQVKPEKRVSEKTRAGTAKQDPLQLARPVKAVKKMAKKADQHIRQWVPKTSAAADMDAGGVILMVAAGIFLITFLISLLLGYTAAQSALYGLLAIVIVVLLIVWLILLCSSGSDSDNDDSDNDD